MRLLPIGLSRIIGVSRIAMLRAIEEETKSQTQGALLTQREASAEGRSHPQRVMRLHITLSDGLAGEERPVVNLSS